MVCTYHASEAVTVPLGVQRDDGLVSDGSAAAVATRRELVSVASRAVGSASLKLQENLLVYIIFTFIPIYLSSAKDHLRHFSTNSILVQIYVLIYHFWYKSSIVFSVSQMEFLENWRSKFYFEKCRSFLWFFCRYFLCILVTLKVGFMIRDYTLQSLANSKQRTNSFKLKHFQFIFNNYQIN